MSKPVPLYNRKVFINDQAMTQTPIPLITGRPRPEKEPSPTLSGEKENFECKQAPTHNEVQVEFNVIPGRTTRTKAVRSAHAYDLLVTNQTQDI